MHENRVNTLHQITHMYFDFTTLLGLYIRVLEKISPKKILEAMKGKEFGEEHQKEI